METIKGYSIGIVSSMLGVKQQTIRMYEQRGLLKPHRTGGNTRLYTDDDLQILKLILHLTQDMGVNLSGVELVFRLNRQLSQLQDERKQLLKLLFEAGEIIQNLIDSQHPPAPSLVRASKTHLVKCHDIG